MFIFKKKKKSKDSKFSSKDTRNIDLKHPKKWKNEDVVEWVECHIYSEEALEIIKSYVTKENLLGSDLLELTPTDLKENLKELRKIDIFKFHLILEHLQQTKRFDSSWVTIFCKLHKLSPDEVETVKNFTNILSDQELFYEKYFSFYVDYCEMKELEIRSKRLERDQRSQKKVRKLRTLAIMKKENLQKKYEEITREKYIDVNLVALSGSRFSIFKMEEKWLIPCKINITEISEDEVVKKKNLRSWISPLVSNPARLQRSTPFGSFRVAVSIGLFHLEWMSNEVIVPRKSVGNRRSIITQDIPNVSMLERKDIKKFVRTISDVVHKWNCHFHYSQERGEKGGNCQHFVDDILLALGVDIDSLFQGTLGNFVKKIRREGRADLGFHPGEEFRKTCLKEEEEEGEEPKRIEFKNHRQLDDFGLYCMDKVVNLKEEFPEEFFLLKSFDRAFWLRHLRDPTDHVYFPAPISKTSRGCPFGDPRQTMSFLPGSCNVSTFRSNVDAGRLPKKDSIQFEGLFAEYYFNTGRVETDKLLDAFYYCAQAPSIISGEVEKYVGVSLHSSEDGKNHREPLNLVIVLDISGSMSDTFYSGDKKRKMKMDVAKEVLVEVIKVMKKGERLGIVLFDHVAETMQPLERVEEINRDKLIKKVSGIRHRGGTNMEIGLRSAISMIKEVISEEEEEEEEGEESSEQQKNENEKSPRNHRIIFLTDAHPNSGGGPETLIGLARRASKEKIFCSFVGIGLDFNSSMVDKIAKIRGSNYYAVNSEEEFKKILNEGFNYLVTPICFNTILFFESEGLEIDVVYGTPHREESTNVLTKIDTMCASPKSDELGVKGGMLLLKLKENLTPNLDPSTEIKMTLRYEYPDGERVQFSKTFDFEKKMEELILSNKIYENVGIRKLVLLASYGQLMRDTIEAAHQRRKNLDSDSSHSSPTKKKTKEPKLSENMVENLKKFKEYYMKEMEILDDPSLEKEIDALDKLMNIK